MRLVGGCGGLNAQDAVLYHQQQAWDAADSRAGAWPYGHLWHIRGQEEEHMPPISLQESGKSVGS